MKTNELATMGSNLTANPIDMWLDPQTFEQWQRVAVMLSKSELVPKQYQEKPQNVMLAMEMAKRMNIGAIVVMQNLDVIDGRQSWKSTFVASMINACGRFKPLRYKYEDGGLIDVNFTEWGPKDPTTGKSRPVQKTVKIQNLKCTAYAEELASGEIMYGETISVEMAVQENWYFKTNSKWKTMTRQMLAYRAATFFARLHEPHLLNGMHTVDEVIDITDMQNTAPNPLDKVNNSFGAKPNPIANDTPTIQIVDAQEVHDGHVVESTNDDDDEIA